MNRRELIKMSAGASVASLCAVLPVAAFGAVYSCDPNYPGYEEWKALENAGLRVRAYLDGKFYGYSDIANEREGWIRTAVTDEEGYIVIENDAVKTEILHGRVKTEIFKA